MQDSCIDDEVDATRRDTLTCQGSSGKLVTVFRSVALGSCTPSDRAGRTAPHLACQEMQGEPVDRTQELAASARPQRTDYEIPRAAWTKLWYEPSRPTGRARPKTYKDLASRSRYLGTANLAGLATQQDQSVKQCC